MSSFVSLLGLLAGLLERVFIPISAYLAGKREARLQAQADAAAAKTKSNEAVADYHRDGGAPNRLRDGSF